MTEPVPTLAKVAAQLADLQKRVAQVDRQSRCRHVWEPDRKDTHLWRCAECGGEDLKSH